MKKLLFVILFAALCLLYNCTNSMAITINGFVHSRGFLQSNKPAISPLFIHYVLKADITDCSGYDIEIHLRHVPHHFQLAMATHHEYDDRFWRFVQKFRIEIPDGKASYTKKDSALWDISIPGNTANLYYRIQLPKQQQFAHRPFLAPYGGLVGDMHSFMYLVGQMHTSCSVTFHLPRRWEIATGLQKTADDKTFIAASAKTLLDCPVLAGHLHKWSFTVNKVPHTIAYLSANTALGFDTTVLVGNIKKIVLQTVHLFGAVPYKNYFFLLEDGVYGALEHGNSVTIGAPDTLLSHHMQDIYSEIAHEFSHTWNLMSIKPAEYTELNYGPQEQSAGLWFSEGMAMFYADLLLRRAGLPVEENTRIAHLENLIRRYYADTGNTVIPPRKVSLASNAAPGMLGDYSASVHLQGELLGTMLDLLIRNTTNGQHSIDYLMRLMFKRFGGTRGFYAKDIEQVVKDVCGDNKVHTFFENYVYEGKPLDFNLYLQLIGLQLHLSWQPALNDKRQLAPDTRLYIWQPQGETAYHLVMTNPNSSWVKAGLHTGDIITAINTQPLKNRQDFYAMLKALQLKDTIIVQINRNGNVARVPVVITGYDAPIAQITKINNPNDRVQRLYEEWLWGK
ncbi:MAG: hypothetical protein JWR09_599 [Mucilaginibacter sp.]|nr:hypothetical protein [Mucilaginibacter sp.]